jgi:hypothetical protein
MVRTRGSKGDVGDRHALEPTRAPGGEPIVRLWATRKTIVLRDSTGRVLVFIDIATFASGVAAR